MAKKTAAEYFIITTCRVNGWCDPKQRIFNFDFTSRSNARWCAIHEMGLKPSQFTILRSDQKIVLKANKREGWPEERATYEGPSGTTTHVVRVKPRGNDDGLREVTTDQIKELS